MGHMGGRGEAWPPVVISTIMVIMISTIGGHADKRQPSEGELLQRAPHHHHHHSLTPPPWSDETEERRPEREGELLPRAPLFHLRLSSVLGTATSLTDQLTDTSTPTLTSRQL